MKQNLYAAAADGRNVYTHIITLLPFVVFIQKRGASTVIAT